MTRAFALLAALVALSSANQTTYDCRMRQLGLDFAAQIQPFRDQSYFQSLADAFNGSPEAANCTVAPGERQPTRVPVRKDADPTAEVYVDALAGSDSNPGTIQSPVQTISKGVALSRLLPAAGRTVFLRAGTFYLQDTIMLDTQDSGLTIAAYNGEEVWISGGILIQPQWKLYNSSTYSTLVPNVSDVYAATPTPGVVVNFGNFPNMSDCQAACIQNTSYGGCTDWTWHDGNQGGYSYSCWFRYDSHWSPHNDSGHYSGQVTRRNIYIADLTGQGVLSAPGLREDGARVIRARYPNGNPERGFGSRLRASGWVPNKLPPQPDIEVFPLEPFRNSSYEFQQYQLGIGGPCEVFTPPAGFWCGNHTSGGGASTYHMPSGMIASATVLPNSPYGHPEGAVVQTWQDAGWESWMFEIGSAANTGGTNVTYTFSNGGFQGARAGNNGGYFYIENVFEELDYPGEYFYNESTQLLYLNYNGTDAPSPKSLYVVTNLKVLLNITGTQSAPVVNVTVSGVNFRDTAYTYMDPHGMPSGGDWALQRTAAVFIQGTEGVIIEDGIFTRLDGNGLMLSGYNRGAVIQRNEFAWIGDTAIAQWGDTQGVPEVPGMGWDGSNGDQPRGTQILYNFVHELGIWEKQSSFYFQAKSCQTLIMGNIFFNGPRAGINFNDGFGGGSNITYNLMLNWCRESGDHGPFNSWDRQIYVTDILNPGQPSVVKQYDDISHNFILANYNSQEGIDNDDGSQYYHTHDNFMSYSGNGMKNDFGGHDNTHHGNVYAFVGQGYNIWSQYPEHLDYFFNNTVVLKADGSYGNGPNACSGESIPVVFDNVVYSPTGNVTECNVPLSKWQSEGHDPGTTAAPYPPDIDDIILSLGKEKLALP